MPGSPLRTLSVDFAVQILDLVKMLKIGMKRLFPIRSGEPGPVSAQTFMKRNMLMGNRISFPSCKSP